MSLAQTGIVTPLDLESIALRAVELIVQGRTDDRLLVVSRATLRGPRKTARLLAGLANSSGRRQPLLLCGVDRQAVVGLEEAPSQRWLGRLAEGFAGGAPAVTWAMISVDPDTTIAAFSLDVPSSLLAAWRRDKAVVPFVDTDGKLTEAFTHTAPTRTGPATIPPLAILGGWIERRVEPSDPSVAVYRGRIDVELPAESGYIADAACSATMVTRRHPSPVALRAQVHPDSPGGGLARDGAGLTVQASFRAQILVATAHTEAPTAMSSGPGQLVVSMMLPGRAAAELQTLAVHPADDTPGRWLVRPSR